jgi:hypothetical protein
MMIFLFTDQDVEAEGLRRRAWGMPDCRNPQPPPQQ